ncbi:TetR family transcriptional regulator [Yangia mangrovi]|nr:TetR family transcriptional regulator [Alloyangia mangrovi]MCT4371824.1 TetR family transcriptional regulator [Alloyangia mangrovi]
MISYASAAEDKEARREVILEAALALFLEDTRRLPTVAAVASRSKLAKGTIYIYFDSKEQIFASLLIRELRAFIAFVTRYFENARGDGPEIVAEFVAQYVSYVRDHPSLMWLDSMGYAMLEPNLTDAQALDLNLQFAEALEDAGRAMDAVLGLPQGEGVELLIRSFALTRGLWQLVDIPQSVRTNPSFASHPFARMDFGRDLARALTQYWRGAWEMSPRPDAPDAGGS